MGSLLAQCAAAIKDRLFPVFCVGCNSEGRWCCAECLAKLADDQLSTEIFGFENSALTGVSALLKYQDGSPLATLLQAYKYSHVEDVEPLFQSLIGNVISLAAPGILAEVAPGAPLIPIPLHPRRQRERGFNQATRLAAMFKEALANLGCTHPILPSQLKRVRYTDQQAHLGKTGRAQNMAGAFRSDISTPAPIEVILLDDVYTTGATLEQAAQALKTAGVKKVWGLTLAKTCYE